MAENIGQHHTIHLSSHIENIQRDAEVVNIQFTNAQGLSCKERFDGLILANAPFNWPQLGLDTTELDQECIDNVSYYRYPVAICKIKGLESKQYFFPKALERSGFGHVALITTRDNRNAPEDGRLCTIYVNQLPKTDNFDFQAQWATIQVDLQNIEGVSEIELVDTMYWPDYIPTLPWELRLRLEKQQCAEETKTLYLGAYTLGAFEDVLSTANKAYNTVNRLFGTKHYEPVENFSLDYVSPATMFYGKAREPYSGHGQEQEKKMRGCTIL